MKSKFLGNNLDGFDEECASHHFLGSWCWVGDPHLGKMEDLNCFEKQDILLDQGNSTAKVVTTKSTNLEAYLAQSFNSQI